MRRKKEKKKRGVICNEIAVRAQSVLTNEHPCRAISYRTISRSSRKAGRHNTNSLFYLFHNETAAHNYMYTNVKLSPTLKFK